MKPVPHSDRKDLLKDAGQMLMRKLGCSVRYDGAIAEECFVMGDITLEKMDGIESPNEFKKAGCHAFWIQKLKPFIANPIDKQKRMQRHLMVNEIAAFMYGHSILMQFGHSIPRDENLINDLFITLRYSSLSPSAFVLIFEALVKDPHQSMVRASQG